MSFQMFSRFFLLLFGVIFLLIEFIWVYPNLKINNVISMSLMLGGFLGIIYFLFTGLLDDLAKYANEPLFNFFTNLTKMISFICLVGFIVSLIGLFYGICWPY
jgi:hypothetical protein